MSLHGGQTLAPYASGINVGVQQTSSVLSVQRPRLLGFSVMGSFVRVHAKLRSRGAVSWWRAQVLGCSYDAELR